MGVPPHKISGQRVAVIVDGDYKDEKHRINATISAEALRQEGYNVDNIYFKQGTAENALAAFRRLSSLGLKKGDEVVVYFTGHGDLDKDTKEPGVVLSDRTLYASEFVNDLKGLGCEVTIVMDQCYSGNFARRFLGAWNIRFMALSGKDLTDNCPEFAQRLWRPTKEADDNKDGRVSWQERFDYATDDTGIPEYGMAVYFAGAEVKEKVFDREVVKIDTAAGLEAELAKLEFGQHAVVMFSSPYCQPCQTYKPSFEGESDGHYKFIIVETDNYDGFEKFGVGKGTPEVRIYGKELPPQGISMDAMSPEILNEAVPQFLIEREPLVVAKGWLENGTPEQQRAAVRIVEELLTDKGQKNGFLKGVLTDARFSNDVKKEAISILGDLQVEENREAKVILENFVKDAGLPFELRALAAAEVKMQVHKFKVEDEPKVDQFFKKADPMVEVVLLEALTRHYYELDDFTASVAAQFAPADDVVVLGLAKRVFENRGPLGLLNGFVYNDAVLKIFKDEAKKIAAADGISPYIRAYIVISDEVAWDKKEQAKALKALFLSKDLPVQFMDVFSLYGTLLDTLLSRTMTESTTHELAVRIYKRYLKPDGALPYYVVGFIRANYSVKLASRIDNEYVRKALVRTIDSGDRPARNMAIELIWRFKFKGDVELFERLAAKDMPVETRSQAIMTIPFRDERFKKALQRIIADTSDDLKIIRLARDKFEVYPK